MKLKYLTYSKEKQKEIKDTFFKTEKGLYAKKKLKNSLICACLCIILALYLFIDAFLNDPSLFNIIYAGIVLIFGIALCIIYHKTLIKILNNYTVKNKL